MPNAYCTLVEYKPTLQIDAIVTQLDSSFDTDYRSYDSQSLGSTNRYGRASYHKAGGQQILHESDY